MAESSLIVGKFNWLWAFGYWWARRIAALFGPAKEGLIERMAIAAMCRLACGFACKSLWSHLVGGPMLIEAS